MIIPLRFSLSKIGLPVILIKAQAKNLCLLLDTGSNINILDRRVAEFFQLSASPIRQKQFGIDGTLQTSAVVELAFSLEEREYKADFSVMDLSSAFGKVEEESGIQIHVCWDALSWSNRNGFWILRNYACSSPNNLSRIAHLHPNNYNEISAQIANNFV